MNKEFKSDSSTPSRLTTPGEQLILRVGLFANLVFLVYIVSSLSSIVLVKFGNSQYSAGNTKLGTASYTLAQELSWGLKKAVNQCSAEVAGQQYELAIEHCSNAIKINKFHASAYYNRGLAYHNLAQNERAIADFTKAIELIPVYTWAYIDRGLSYVRQGQGDLAVSDCNKVIVIDEKGASTYPSAHYCLGLAFYAQDNYDLAITNLDKAIELDATSPGVYFLRGSIYDKQGKEDLAIADYTKAIELDPKHMDAYIGRGNAFADAKQFTQAMEDYKKALEISGDPTKNSYTYCVQGVTYIKMNDLQSAVVALKQGVKLNATSKNDWCKSALEAVQQAIQVP
jgi:tetratricopeptide (TPR) repeat protein